MKTWFDSIPAKYRHLLIILGVSVLGAAAMLLQANTQTILNDIPDYLDPFVAGLIGYAILWATKITKQYGVGSDDAASGSVAPGPAAGPDASTVGPGE